MLKYLVSTSGKGFSKFHLKKCTIWETNTLANIYFKSCHGRHAEPG